MAPEEVNTSLGTLTKNFIWNPDALSWEALAGFPITVNELIVSGVAVSNFPPSQTVNGSVDVANFPNVQTTEALSYLLKLDESSPPVTYVGEALPGSADDDYVWRIKQIDETSGVVIAWANGHSTFDKQWSDRTNYSYS